MLSKLFLWNVFSQHLRKKTRTSTYLLGHSQSLTVPVEDRHFLGAAVESPFCNFPPAKYPTSSGTVRLWPCRGSLLPPVGPEDALKSMPANIHVYIQTYIYIWIFSDDLIYARICTEHQIYAWIFTEHAIYARIFTKHSCTRIHMHSLYKLDLDNCLTPEANNWTDRNCSP